MLVYFYTLVKVWTWDLILINLKCIMPRDEWQWLTFIFEVENSLHESANYFNLLGIEIISL